MDYLDPKKQIQHRIRLLVGYVLVGVAVIFGTVILLYQAYGFGLGKNGKVIQNGLVFLSSQPHPARIYINGALKSVRTNVRLSLPAGIYNVTLTRDGYRDWQRVLPLTGGSVEHFDYPFLIPKALAPKAVADYAGTPRLTTQSPDRRWLLVQRPGPVGNFDLYDLKIATKAPVQPPVRLALPAGLLSKATGSEGWQLGEWADDNKHVLLRHIYDGHIEYVLVDRTDAAQSINLNQRVTALPSRVSLADKKFDQYYAYDTAGRLSKVSLKQPVLQPLIDHVLAYKPYGKDTVLYVTDSGAPAGKALLRLRSGAKTYTIRAFPAGPGARYLVDLAGYKGKLYVVASASSADRIYVYKDPLGQLSDNPSHLPVPAQVLRVNNPDYLSFSDNAQFVMAERASEFAVYDIENKQVYHYNSLHRLDKPQTHAGWMDGDRLVFTSAGKLFMSDYDNANRQVLVASSGRYLPAFTPDYKSVYTLAPATAGHGHFSLYRTPLLTPADQ